MEKYGKLSLNHPCYPFLYGALYSCVNLLHNQISFLLEILFSNNSSYTTVKILKIGTPGIITIVVLQLEQLDFTVQYCVQKMQTE